MCLTIPIATLYVKFFCSIFENGNEKKRIVSNGTFKDVLPTRAPKFQKRIFGYFIIIGNIDIVSQHKLSPLGYRVLIEFVKQCSLIEYAEEFKFSYTIQIRRITPHF
jgi:hypothetical protein